MSEMKTATNAELEAKINDENAVIIDVREDFEYNMGHVPNSLLIPLGELNVRYSEIDKDKEVYVICRTGNRSDYAVRFLMMQGFENVYNVLPGMIGWNGEIER